MTPFRQERPLYRIRQGVTRISEALCSSVIAGCLKRQQPSQNATPLETYILDLRRALRVGSPFSAIALALALPDICGSIEYPDVEGVGRRYTDWCDTWAQILPIRGAECYALRCAYLHNGSGSFRGSSAKRAETFNAIELTIGQSGGGWLSRAIPAPRPNLAAPMRGRIPHETFCRDMSSAAWGWWMHRKENPAVVQAVGSLLKLTPV